MPICRIRFAGVFLEFRVRAGAAKPPCGSPRLGTQKREMLLNKFYSTVASGYASFLQILFASRPKISHSLGVITPLSHSSVLSAQNALKGNQAGLLRTTTRLATGRRINSGGDDPAGLISSERLAAEIKSLEAETRSLQHTNAYANISEGHTAQLSSLMGELNTLAIASANQAGMTDSEIAANQMQVDNILANIERIGGDAVTSFSRLSMSDGGNAEVENLVNGAVSVVSSMRSGGANSLAGEDIEAAQEAIQGAINDIATARGQIGAYQKYTVEPRIQSNQIAIENLADARSRIADADFAVETSNLTRFEILSAVGVKTLKIAQQQGESVLALLS